jgi:hypothetical protein
MSVGYLTARNVGLALSLLWAVLVLCTWLVISLLTGINFATFHANVPEGETLAAAELNSEMLLGLAVIPFLWLLAGVVRRNGKDKQNGVLEQPSLRTPKVAGLVVLVAWTASLFLPTFRESTGNAPTGFGWLMLMFGWAFAHEGHLGWYANPLLIWNGVRMTNGRPPNSWAALLAILLAATALFPISREDLLYWDEDEPDWIIRPAIGAYVWAAATVPPLFIGCCRSLSNSRLYKQLC